MTIPASPEQMLNAVYNTDKPPTSDSALLKRYKHQRWIINRYYESTSHSTLGEKIADTIREVDSLTREVESVNNFLWYLTTEEVARARPVELRTELAERVLKLTCSLYNVATYLRELPVENPWSIDDVDQKLLHDVLSHSIRRDISKNKADRVWISHQVISKIAGPLSRAIAKIVNGEEDASNEVGWTLVHATAQLAAFDLLHERLNPDTAVAEQA